MEKTKALQKLLDGTATEEEIGLLKQLLASGEISVGGNVNDSVIISGDGNNVQIFQLTPEALNRLDARFMLGNLDRDLTNEEIASGLRRLERFLPHRAPVLQIFFQEQARRVRPTLKTTAKTISEQSRRERAEALAMINGLCMEALDISFNALCLGEEPPKYDGRSPFRGLESFRPEDSEFFFGREALTKKLVAKIQSHPFLAVLGASGSGKSSLVMAGLIPALDLEYVIFRPGTKPLDELESARGKSLIVVDQFEELFTLTRDETTRKEFIAKLLEAKQKIVITLRSDFLGEVGAYRALSEEIQNHLEIVPPMDMNELRRAMEGQARTVGLRFEADLSQQILDDVEGEPGAMPLLQHALWELWNRRHGRWLRASEYRAFGGVKQAITSTAEKVYGECAKAEQEQMRDIFLRLTRLDESDEGRDTRRRVPLTDLIPSGQEPASITLLLDKLANARLIVKTVNEDKTEIEVAHEALIRHWERLRAWLNEDRDNLKLRESVSEDAKEWENAGRDESLLNHRGGRLDDALSLGDNSRYGLTEIEQTYLNAGVSLRNREQRERERRLRWTVTASVAVAVIFLVLAGFGLLKSKEATDQATTAQANANAAETAQANADTESKRANAEAEIALARRLAAQADLLISQEPKKLPLAVLLSLESIKHANTAEGSDALRKGLSLLPNLVAKFQIMPSSSFYGDQNVIRNPVTVLKFSPDGRWLGVGTEDAIISVWDTSTWKEVLHVEPATQGGIIGVVRSLSFSPDGNLLITGTAAEIAQVWDIASGKEISRLKHDDQIWIVDFTPDGKRVISGAWSEVVVWDPRTGKEFYRLKAGTDILVISSNGKLAASAAGTDITVWDVETGKILTTKTQFIRRDNNDLRSISALAFSPDGSMIASSEGKLRGGGMIPPPPSTGGRIVVWDPLTGNDIATMQHGDSVPALEFSSDGKKLVSGSFDRTSRVWDVSTGRPLSNFSFETTVGAVAFGKKDEWIISSSADGTARIWDASTGEEINRLVTENDTNIESIAISPNGEFVAGGNDEGVWVWQIEGQEIAKMKHGQALTISSADYSPDGKILVTASWDRKARTWDTKTGDLIATVVHEKQAFLSVFDPKGKFVASADLGGQVKIWDPLTGIEPFQIPKFKEISQVLFSPDGRFLAISEGLYPRDGWQAYSFQVDREGGVVSIWDVAKGKEVARLNHGAIVNSIAFSPDGKQILTASKDGVARLWGIETKTIISKVEFNDFVSVVALSPDGQLAAGVESCSPTGMGTGSCTPKLRVWKPLTGKILWDTSLDGRWVSNLTFSPNSKLLVTENNFLKSCTQKDCKNRAIVWNALNGVVISEKKYEYEFGLMVLAFNKDSTLLATGGGPSHNGWVDIWDPESGTEISRIFYQQALSAVFSPTEKTIAIVGNQDGVAYSQIFSLDTPNLVNVACSRLKRNLTEQEWKDYLGDIPYQDICPNLIQESNDPNGPSYESSISRDGQWVVFVSEASNLVCGNTNTLSDIFVYNRDKDLIQKISDPVYGQNSNGESSPPYISGNGNYVVYASSANNLVAGDVNKEKDIFLYDRITGQTELISVNSKNEQAKGYSQGPSVSDDGRFVVFQSSATNLVSGDNNEKDDIFVRDRKTGETRMVSISPDGSLANNDSWGPWISPDGEIIKFYSRATNLDLVVNENSESDLYLYDQKSGALRKISSKLVGGYGKFSVDLQTIQGDGSSGEYELKEVTLYDFETNTSKIISTDSKGNYANRDSRSPAISDDGRFVVFASEANNLVEGDTNLAWDIFLWDRQTGEIQRIIMGKDGTQPEGHSLGTGISGDGRYVIFTSTASNLVDGDFNAMRDVFIYDTQNKTTKRIEPMTCAQEK